MDVDFERENVELMANGKACEVEHRLLERYEHAKRTQDLSTLSSAISSLAHFYSLPFKEDFAKAEHYFHEVMSLAPTAESALELVMFYYYSVQDPVKTLDATNRVRSLTDRNVSPRWSLRRHRKVVG
jgi:hypothetical protein